MQLPHSLQSAIERLNESFNIDQLLKAREELTQRYRHPSHSDFMTTDAQRQVYLNYRLPATYAALHEVFRSIQAQIMKDPAPFSIKSILDLGGGPGTGIWAACENFPEIEQATLIEKDSALMGMGKRLAQLSEYSAVKTASWQELDLERVTDLPPHDLVLLSYSIGELHPEKMRSILKLCWQSAKQLLIIVEPGTPVGFERIRSIRHHLIEWGAHLIAPCPHHLACPMVGEDWCHFSARVERSSLHRRLKGGTLGYEDEKFSYVAATKEPFSLPDSRVLSEPLRRSGHVLLKLCIKDGEVQEQTISKKKGDRYKQARKARWGDAFS